MIWPARHCGPAEAAPGCRSDGSGSHGAGPRAAPVAPDAAQSCSTRDHGSTSRSTSGAITFEISLINAVRTHALRMHTQDRLGGDIAVPVAANPQLTGRTRRATVHTRALRSADQVPRNPPEKPASPPSAGARNRWSGACTPARGARLTRGRGGGGHAQSRDHRVIDPTKSLVTASCLCSA